MTIQSDNIQNLRDLGGLTTMDGKKVKPGLLFRSGKLDAATASDIEMLSNSLHIGKIVDFRMEDEAKQAPDPTIPGVENVYIKVFQTQSSYETLRNSDPVKVLKNILDEHFLQNFYWEILDSELGQKGYSRFLNILADTAENEAVLWHCSEGKDRAGLAAFLILHILGVSREQIIQDFLYSNTVYAQRIEAFRKSMATMGFKDADAEELVTVVGVSAAYLENTIIKLEEKYGSLDIYIRDRLGVDDGLREILRGKYLCG